MYYLVSEETLSSVTFGGENAFETDESCDTLGP